MIERTLRLDACCHTPDAVQRAAYRFSDRLAAEVRTDDDEIVCLLSFADDLAERIDELLADFRNEVLDQVLRERIRRETEPVRNLILALAFSNTAAAVNH
jgi:His-Xaa-Ser system protein HxsD